MEHASTPVSLFKTEINSSLFSWKYVNRFIFVSCMFISYLCAILITQYDHALFESQKLQGVSVFINYLLG